jgi:flagellin
MARINTNISSLIAQSNLQRANQDLSVRLQRLSTGLRINRGADDPAGLIISERLRTEIETISQGVKNSERASNVISTTEASLSEVSDLLNSIKSLVVEAANTGAFSDEEIAANQQQIDSAIDTITRIANTSSFAGLQLLDGALGYTLSGIDSSSILTAHVNSANFLQRSDVQVDVEVVGSAQQASLYLRTDFSNIAAGGVDGQLLSTVTLEIAGAGGVQVLTFASGTSISDIVAAVNELGASTGVRAEAVNAGDVSSGLRFYSTEFGSDSFVSVQRLGASGDFWETYKFDNNNTAPTSDLFADPNIVTAGRDTGKDVVAVVNGALATGRGLNLSVRTSELDLKMLLDTSFGQTVDGSSQTFHITGGGSLFQLGPKVVASQQVNIGIPSVTASRLGATLVSLLDGSQEVQFLSSLKSGGINELAAAASRRDFRALSDVIDSSIDEIATLRGRLGAFERNTVQTNIRSLQAALENVTASESVIRDADFAKETSELTRAQILVQSTSTVLATANSQSQSVLQLLG